MNFGTVTTKRAGKRVTIKVACQSIADAETLEVLVQYLAEDQLKQLAAKKPHKWEGTYAMSACWCGRLEDSSIHVR